MRKLSASRLEDVRQACVNLAHNKHIPITAGPYSNAPMDAIEYVLHEIGHAVGLKLKLTEFTGADIDASIKKLSGSDDDFNEAQAVAVEFFLARRLGVPLSRQKVLRFAKTGTQLSWSLKAWRLFVADRERELTYSDEAIYALRMIRAEVAELT